MVITLLSAIGLYSMRAASLADQAAGFNRLGTQTTYVAEFAGRAVAAELVGKEQHYFQYISAGTDDCRANRQLTALMDPTRPSCYKLEGKEIWERVHAEFPGNVGTEGAPDLLGRIDRHGLTEGAFIVEMTDLGRTGTPVAGEDVAADTFKHMQVLLTATGQVRPPPTASGDNGWVCNTSFSLRSHVTFGPVH
jgi:hypothetical protein